MSEDVETYLGGFYSPIGVSIGHVGLKSPIDIKPRIGAGVYATSRRLFIIGPGKATFPSSLKKIAAGSDKGDFVPSSLTKDQNDALIGALTQNKRFEIGRSQVSQIEVKKPPGFLRTGSLKITSADGQTLDIRISLNMHYEWTVRLVQAFKPEAVTLD
jgi:hypothetical protein